MAWSRSAAENALAALERLKGMGYCESCALDAGAALLRARFADAT
jgi:serine protein kinase